MRPLSRRLRAATAATVVALSALVSLTVTAPTASAQDDDLTWSVVPVPPEGKTNAPRNYFILEGDPGAVIKDEVRIQNWTDHPITFVLFGADAYNTDGAGAFALRGKGEKMTDVGRWVKPKVKRLTVYGRTQADVPITFRIPANATPGDHVGGLVALNTQIETKTEGGVAVGVQRAIAARAYVRVSGNTSPGFEIRDVKVEHDRGIWPWTGRGNGRVTYTVENTGNLRLSLTGDVTVKGVGKDATHALEDFEDLLPGAEVTLTRKIDGIASMGVVDVEVELTAGEDLRQDGSHSFTLVPWPGLVLVVVLLALGLWWWRRRRDAARRRLHAASEAPRISVMAGA